MFRTLVSVAAVILALSGASVVTGNTMFRSALHDYRVVTVVAELVQPWSIAFLPDGDMLITERPGRLRVVRGASCFGAGRRRAEGVPLVAGRTARSHASSELRLESADLSELLEARSDGQSGDDGTRTRPVRRPRLTNVSSSSKPSRRAATISAARSPSTGTGTCS